MVVDGRGATLMPGLIEAHSHLSFTDVAQSVELGFISPEEHMLKKALHGRGVRVLIGGDYGFAWNPIGTNARDIGHFVDRLEFSPMDAIMAATRLGGQIMGMGDRLGQVRPGYLADLLLVDGDTLENVAILLRRDRLKAIMKDGAFWKSPASGFVGA